MALLANWLPDPSPEFGSDPKFFVGLMVTGFIVAVIGHLVRSKVGIAVGIGLIFLATFLLPLATNISKS